MLLATDLNELEQQRAELWELCALILDFDPDFRFTAKELSKELHYSKKQLNQYLYRLHLKKALTTHSKAPNGATIYSLNPAFLSGKLSE